MMGEMETIALEQADIIERLVRMNKELLAELSQHRRIDAEERELETLVQKMGGGLCGNQ